MTNSQTDHLDDSLYPIAVLIDELRNEEMQVQFYMIYMSTISNSITLLI